MQRSNNAGGSGANLWTTANIGLGSSGSTFSGPANRSLSNPTVNVSGHEALPVYGYNQPTASLHFKPNWGQPDSDPMTQQASSTTLWKNDPSVHGGSSDHTRSFLGTEQWGRESGGAPWGSTSHTESSSSATELPGSSLPPRTTDPSMFSHVTNSSWLASRKSPVFLVQQEADNKTETAEANLNAACSEGEKEVSNHEVTEESTQQPSKQPIVPAVVEDSEKLNAVLQMESQTDKAQKHTDDSTVAEKSDKLPESVPAPYTDEEGYKVSAPEEPKPEPTDVETLKEGQSSSDDNAVGATIEHIQQLNLMDSYVAQQQNFAAQLTGYQLAMQQQYALAAQQQQLAAPGMFLPNSYIIPAQTNTHAGYGDPNSSGQFPMMAQYSPYASWPATAGIYPMLQQQMAAVAASASQPTSSSASQPNRAATQTPQSPSQSPSSQHQEGAQQQSDILANVAAMQQNNINQAMALAAGYPMIPGYYDQSGALIINNGRGSGPVRLFTPGPVFMNGSQPLMPPQMTGGNGSMFRYNQSAQQQVAANALYTNQQSMSGGSTPVPSLNQGFNPAIPHGTSSSINSLGIGTLGTGIGSASSTPQRRDSFSDYSKHQQPHSGITQFYSSLGVSPGGGGGMSAMSPSPGPLGNIMTHSHHSLSSPPPSMSSPTSMMIGSGNRMFSAAPGAETKYRNGSYVSPGIFGNSGSSLFPPTRIRPIKDTMMTAGRSKLLDDFRNNRLSNPLLHELVNHVVEFSQDQHGSRFIQQKLERATPSEKQQVFNEIIGSAYQLMTDVFGNYVIQKFFEFGSLEHKVALANCIHGHVLPLALQMYGCRVIQKALECIPQEQQVEIVKELNGHLLKCVKDQNGNHVVQKCIECVPPVHLQFIVDGFKGQVVGLSSHPYGCRVMQRILEHCTDEQTAPILEELHQHTEMLVKDQYGNYVIQHILEHGHPEQKSQIVNELRGKILALSQHKFASNVIEKCVSHSSPQNRAWLIEEICQEPDALFIMMKDQYANYVVQKMLDVAEPQQKKALIHKIRPHVLTLRKFTYGKHIITKLEKFFLKNVGTSTSSTSAGAGDLSSSQLSPAGWVLDSSE
ncbi:pumilio homolog 1-like isoform X1 [Clavelina lepadiformis]|uniref:pumilio homolog 1-like isoform X1 n=1 Tax=Clavelina lepadiformis TaxID=159417 RepID=UPI004042DC8A